LEIKHFLLLLPDCFERFAAASSAAYLSLCYLHAGRFNLSLAFSAYKYIPEFPYFSFWKLNQSKHPKCFFG